MTTVRIIGGGIAGLTLACTLRRPEWDVTVYEPLVDGAHEVDTAFGLWRPAMDALDEIGLGDRVREHGMRVTRASVRTADDRVLARIRGQDVVMIGRASLRRILRQALPPSVRWKQEEVHSTHDSDADVVVGADGVRSVVRRDHWGARSGSKPLRTTVIRGVVDRDLSGGEVTEYWGEGVLFGLTPLPGGRTNWFTASDERRFPETQAGIEHVRRLTRRFPSQVEEVLVSATTAQTLINGIAVSRPLVSFVRGRAVLIGDAAHAMTPTLGRGACEAIRDAVALGTMLNAREPHEALARYRCKRLVAPQLFRSASSLVSRVSLARGRAARLRDLIAAGSSDAPERSERRQPFDRERNVLDRSWEA